MKYPFLLVCCAALISISSTKAGPHYANESKQVAPAPCPEWYRDRGWNLGISAAFAFTNSDYPTVENSLRETTDAFPEHDRYLKADHAWGGSADLKYFFCRYFGVGIQGFGLDVRQSYADILFDPTNVFAGTNYSRTSHTRKVVGGALATFTLRYPIGCSRFAPYVFAGGGAIFGGGQQTSFQTTQDAIGVGFTSRSDAETKAMVKFGGGLEVRITPHVGWTNYFSWYFVDGGNNNFGMARTGINFAF
jgi:hypothetical protein